MGWGPPFFIDKFHLSKSLQNCSLAGGCIQGAPLRARINAVDSDRFLFGYCQVDAVRITAPATWPAKPAAKTAWGREGEMCDG